MGTGKKKYSIVQFAFVGLLGLIWYGGAVIFTNYLMNGSHPQFIAIFSVVTFCSFYFATIDELRLIDSLLTISVTLLLLYTVYENQVVIYNWPKEIICIVGLLSLICSFKGALHNLEIGLAGVKEK